ncbi:MAG: peptide chain release factor 2 [Candidatus Margulisbacteria bacterium]|nr:peptide chain release factor 2 [Candidatus Margulisiibacteriota bacterium]
MIEDYKSKTEEYLNKATLLEGYLQINNLLNDKAMLERQLQEKDIWNDHDKASKLSKEIKLIEHKLKDFSEFKENINYIQDLLELNDQSLEQEIKSFLIEIGIKYKKLELKTLLNEPYDQNDVILTINAGVGGTDAQDWAEMLLRMYKRWIEDKSFNYEIIDISVGDEAGLKSVTLTIEGEYAYGLLKSEHGIHRLVRLSPFNANNKRQTSFASVDVLPQLDLSKEINIRPEDIRVDTYRSSGAGGQHINKTDSAVRITHLKTGIVVQCQSGRSQTQNKEKAMQVLISRIETYNQKIEEQEKKNVADTNKEISWGNQIRSYVFHPYTMVKDLRTDYETGNVGAVMDGEIDSFIEAYLHFRKD